MAGAESNPVETGRSSQSIASAQQRQPRGASMLTGGDTLSDALAPACGPPLVAPAQDGMPWNKFRAVLLAACIGNVLVWYDFALYGGFATEFGSIFFPPCSIDDPNFASWTQDEADAFCVAPLAGINDQETRHTTCPTTHCCTWDANMPDPIVIVADIDPVTGQISKASAHGNCRYDPVEKDQLLKSFGVFAGAFVMRPVGGVVIGTVGDKFGRKAALQLAITLMLFPSLLLAVLPTYSQIGYAATFGLLTIRLCQGVAAGSELVGSMLYTVESARRRTVVPSGPSFGFSFAIVGTMIGTLVSARRRSSVARLHSSPPH